MFYYQGLSLNDESKQHEQECLIFHGPPTGVALCKGITHTSTHTNVGLIKTRVLSLLQLAKSPVCVQGLEHICCLSLFSLSPLYLSPPPSLCGDIWNIWEIIVGL